MLIILISSIILLSISAWHLFDMVRNKKLVQRIIEDNKRFHNDHMQKIASLYRDIYAATMNQKSITTDPEAAEILDRIIDNAYNCAVAAEIGTMDIVVRKDDHGPGLLRVERSDSKGS